MGIFDFFKRKPIEQKRKLEDNYVLPYFGQIDINNLEEHYRSNFELNNSNIKTDLNFEGKSIEKNKIEQIEAFLKNATDFDKKNKVYIEKDFENDIGETEAYINFYLEELDENELKKIIELDNQTKSKSIQLLNKLKLIRIGFYPDNKYGTSYFTTFDYSIEIDGETSNQLLVVNTDEKGNLDHITWES
ncbi:DUF2004 domain-containing protein [Flavivirga aquimarina]|uniref:DUF2004 domain-containing protein n=1 Tax=Flavivirga aquimarina TaxID=2027862 RepID=A0ABT8WBT7_9FLAO|nr:DUF2004 domain-containing protein [Flavivirga aquimarina]MDO5970580.1 DUF2004 domain-containing protein [Flavivirga aquimarina]